MKFILDANIPYSAKSVFKKPDSALHVRDLRLTSATDDEILKRAYQEGAILVTRDLDFANIILHPIQTHRGVIVIRVPPHFTAKVINDVLKRFLSSVDLIELSSAIIIVEPGNYRIRR